ncbi:hypothetical protein NP233_g2832 [Leucocoprinus birnbaumii]|uniref:Uncharacterized protein n=1 Tax=Leucocoprinus birnbaumii TaxID=56174 RepID=A0AAD5VZZ7_9AGAR|nr:hypothetical protein NP233_g2832 [Leucocoprinus birnbaumii]
MSASFTATPAELALVNQIFAQADKQKLNILNGDVAVQVFGGAKLPGTVLGEIWNIADEENNGWLSRTGTAKALRLIGHAQKGTKVSSALLSKAGPLATIEGYSSVSQQNTGTSAPKSPPPGFPPLSPQDKIRFQDIFNRSGPTNGLLSGDKARDIFLKSKLGNDQLMQIWNLADTRDRGAMDVADFTIAMYFIQGLMKQQFSFVPTTLPPGLYEQASGVPSTVATHLSGNSGSFSPIGSSFGRVQPQYTGQSQPLAQNHTGQAQFNPPNLPARPSPATRPIPTVQTNDAWDVTPTEKAEADAIFTGQLDLQNVGYIEGETAVPFMLKSQLPGEVLAQIWDLADINSDGRLTRDGFAIAYHLIRKKMNGQPLPAQLPPSLIPPSVRKQTSFFQPPSQQPVEPPRDLLDLDDTPPASAVSPQATGTLSVLQPQSTGAASVLRPQSTGATAVPPIPPRNNTVDPFSSSPFGSTAPTSDLMGDHEERPHTTSPPLQDKGAELGNVRNHLQSTNRSLETAKAERAKLESTLASQAAELSALQTQLSSAKAAYDTETTLLSQLRERFDTQSAEIQRSREELIRSESDLSAIRVEKAEIEQAFLRDKEEARDLHRRMIEAGQQADQIKGEVEKAKKEAKQQKGRLAIARKQLATKETERAKAEKELEEANAEAQSLAKEAEEVEAQVAQTIEQPKPVRAPSQDTVDVAAAQPLPASPEPVQSSKSNNPFERLALSSSPSPRSQSPFLPFSNVALTSPPIAPAEGQNGQAKPEPQPSFDDFLGANEPVPAAAPVTIPEEESSKSDHHTNGDSVPKEFDIGSSGPASPLTAESTEHFMTPPTTATNEPPLDSSDNLASEAKARFPTLDETTTQFPPLDDPVPAKAEQKDTAQTMTDLDTKLQELEVEDSDSSDSDSDSDDDDSPLAEVAQKVKERAPSPKAQDASAETATPAPVVAAPQVQSENSFDDIFGLNDTPAASASAPAPQAPKPSSSPFDIPDSTQPSEPPKANNTAGVNAFDETLSGFSPPPWRDSRDIPPSTVGAATTTTAPSAPAPAPQSGAPPAKSSFDDIFGAPSAATTDQPPTLTVPTTNGSTTNGSAAQKEAVQTTTFDDAFANFDTNPNLNLESSFLSTSKSSTNTEPQSPSSKQFPTTGPALPKAAEASSPRPSTNRTSSPGPRPSSPPPRMTSPVPRKSTSSKDSHEKLKEPATRHSKLSIRFPFGKKKTKNQEPTPPPSSTLAPPPEEFRNKTPAGDDDVEAVKQITAMGFTRSQAVEALEKYGYDMRRAIDSLLQ